MIQEIFLTVISSCNAFSSKIDTSFNGGFSRSANDFQSVLITTPSGKNYFVKQYIGLDDNPNNNEIVTPHGYFASATLVGEDGDGPTYTFNCHSFAWLYDGELSNVPSVRYCVDDPYPFISSAPYCCSSYVEYQYPSLIADASSINVGDIIVYYDVDQSSNASAISHSAVVTSSSSNIYNVMVRSKWRFGGTYNHSIFACPYYIPPAIDNDESKIRVYGRANDFISV